MAYLVAGLNRDENHPLEPHGDDVYLDLQFWKLRIILEHLLGENGGLPVVNEVASIEDERNVLERTTNVLVQLCSRRAHRLLAVKVRSIRRPVGEVAVLLQSPSL